MERDPLHNKQIYKRNDRITLSRKDCATTKELYEVVDKKKKLFKGEYYILREVDSGKEVECEASKFDSEHSPYVKTVVTAEIGVEIKDRVLKLSLNDHIVNLGDVSFEDCKRYLNILDSHECLKQKSDVIIKGTRPVNHIYCLERALSTLNLLVSFDRENKSQVIEIDLLFGYNDNDIIIPELKLSDGKTGLLNFFGYRASEVKNKNELTMKWTFENIDVVAVLNDDKIEKICFVESKLLK